MAFALAYERVADKAEGALIVPCLPRCRLIGIGADTSSTTSCRYFVWAATINHMLKVLLCPPDYFDVVDQKNPYMSRELPVDRVKARSQWENLRGVLQHCGCEVETIDPVEGLEDMVFAANQIFAGEKIDQFIV